MIYPLMIPQISIDPENHQFWVASNPTLMVDLFVEVLLEKPVESHEIANKYH
jgi:hypothetical protein